jgi:chemotaxis protein MotA
MEQGTLIGNILAWVLLVVAMTFDFVNFSMDVGKLGYFVDVPSLMIVFGGTIASTFILHPMDEAKTFGKSIGATWKPNNVQLVETLTLIVDVAKIARKNILAIEDALPSIENLFLRSGLRLVVDRVDRQLKGCMESVPPIFR